MTRVAFRPTMGSKVYGNLERRMRGLEMRATDGDAASLSWLIDDAMVAGNLYADSLGRVPWATDVIVNSIPQNRTHLEVVWSAAVQENNITTDHHHAFITVQFNAEYAGGYFSRVLVEDPGANGQPFVNYHDTAADADPADKWIIIGFVNDYFNSEPLGYASGRFIVPNYAVPYNTTGNTYRHYDEQTIAKQVFGSASLGGINSDPSSDMIITGAWGGHDSNDPPSITEMTFRVWDYTTIGASPTQRQFAPGSRFTTIGPVITDGNPRIVNDLGL